MTGSLIEYCSAEEGMIVLPIELLSSTGLDVDAAREYQQRGLLSHAECQRIDAMMAAYANRAGQLAQLPGQWFHPRIQHLCLVTNGLATRPYFQPFHASSWLLYREDLSDTACSIELSIFLLFQAERQYLQQQIGDCLMSNLGYFLILSEKQIDDFCSGCLRSTRPDSSAYQALARAMPWIRKLHHPVFRPPRSDVQDVVSLANGLIVNVEQQQQLAALQQQWVQTAEAVVSSHRAMTEESNANAGQALKNWLESVSPHLVLAGEQGKLLWQGRGTAEPELDTVLKQLSPDAESSIMKDLQVIDKKSKEFLFSISDPDKIAPPAAWMNEGGLSYIHAKSNRIAYSLTDDPDRLRQVSPPYERQMLAARTIHEWGHQAAESGWVRVDPARAEERKAYEQQLIEQLEQTVSELPEPIRPILLEAIKRDAASTQSAGEHLLKALLRRIDDYMANLLARHYLSQDEMDTYVRNNVASRVLDYAPEQALMHLLRIAYEYQYLNLASFDDPKDWFLKSTWFEPLFVQSGIISLERFMSLCDQIALICDCYQIDTRSIRMPSNPL